MTEEAVAHASATAAIRRAVQTSKREEAISRTAWFKPRYQRANDDAMWPIQAACKDVGTADDWVPVAPSRRTLNLVQQYCESCPVRRRCLEAGITSKSSGIWGGVLMTNGHITWTIAKLMHRFAPIVARGAPKK